MTETAPNKPLFRDINADDDDPEITEMESLCMQCHESGTTRLLLTKIPYFKEIIIMSFECPHCHFRDNEVKPGSVIQEKGVRFTLKVNDKSIMNRQIVKQGSALFKIVELDFVASAFETKGVLTTLEGILDTAVTGLQQDQPVRKIMHPDVAEKIDKIIEKLEKYKTGEFPFTFILEDTSGNSFIENPCAPLQDPNLLIEYFERTKEQDEKLGLQAIEEEPEQKEKENKNEEESDTKIKDEVLEFPTNCSACQSPTMTKMKVLQIPYFKEVIIMASSCDVCGQKSNEIKSGGATEPLGSKITFKMTETTDLSRDVLASQTCTIRIPELDIDINHSSMGGKFTTLEGLFVNMKEQLGQIFPFAMGDSAPENNQIKNTINKLDKAISGDLFLTVILDDPVGNSYLQNTWAPDADPNLTIEKYERTEEQNAEFGISDMRTENYI
ncbi:zinc finger protein ZPR1-like [Hydractinia symbiolongicarpus]|uniref:zinc finger protein ZPR1-like n=1 Tax=Hydractinia symbiolongicarpus TaxID=13093 RepID=UPI002551739D|nr:zinc finger protein ZPR1-like [Hydractinia symbiolongicarpus]